MASKLTRRDRVTWLPLDVQSWAATLCAGSRSCLQRAAEMREQTYTVLGEARARLEDAVPAMALDPTLARLALLEDVPTAARRRVLARVYARKALPDS